MAVDPGKEFSREDCLQILEGRDPDVLELVSEAYHQRKAYFGKRLSVHMINNAHNGHCSEDCRYCVQSRDSRVRLQHEGARNDDEILLDAVSAFEHGACYYGIVFSGRSLFPERLHKIAALVRRIKAVTALKICISAGFVDGEQASALKAAGVDRLHHNLNTSAEFYPQICTTHSFDDRIRTIEACKAAGLPVCCGMIVGMGESSEDIVSTAMCLKALNVDCMPVNFYIPLEGATLGERPRLSLEYCLRVLCLFRLVSPRRELCLAAGRELYFRSAGALLLQIVDGFFMQGYLNVQGDAQDDILATARQLGFVTTGYGGRS